MTRILGYIGLVLVVVAVSVWWVRGLVPPTTVRFAAGIEGGGYWRFAERYRTILARDGISLDLIATAGSVENARLLDAGQADAGFLQGGVMPSGDAETLGAVFLEPLLLFARLEGTGVAAPEIPDNVAAWRGLTIAAGPEGSGTRAASEALIAAAGLDPQANTLLPRGAADGAEALAEGAADVAVFVAPLSAPYLETLLADPQVGLIAVDHAVALSRRMPQARIVDVPSGAFSLLPPLPPQDLRLIGLVARIAARPDLHPAVVDRLVEAAIEVHGPGDVLSPEGTFPTMENTSLPEDTYARDRLADGPSVLSGFLPYWIVAQIKRFAILLLPVIFLLLPLLRAIPGLYRFRIRSRVFRYYARIRDIDTEAATTQDPEVLAVLDAELAGIDQELAALKLPLAYREYAYDARLHVELLRRRITQTDLGTA